MEVVLLERYAVYEDRLMRANEPTVDYPVVLPLSASHGLPLIDVNATRTAIDSFYSSSGKIFHAFNKQQTERALSNIIEHQGVPYEAHQADVCCVMAIAAVGAQYVNSRETDKPQEETFYEAAKRYFDYVVENQPLDAVKICALLAMFNTFGKAMVALAYIDIGLSMSRRFGLDSRQCRQPNLTRAAWVDYRRAWRTLIFFSTWLSSTLGCLTSNGSHMSPSPLDMDVCDIRDISEIIQTELSKIAILKAQLLTIQASSKDMPFLPTRPVVQELQQWFDNLPKELRIERMGDVEVPLEARRSLCHIHLLYLGALMLLYRSIAAQHLQSQETGSNRKMPLKLHGETVADYSERGLLAAISSARILKFALNEDWIFKRCWLIIFQAFISSVIILHAAAQQKLHDSGRDHWKTLLDYVQMCMEILAFCGTTDRIATQFHVQLKNIYDALLEDQLTINNGDIVTTGDGLPAVHQASIGTEAAETLYQDHVSSGDEYLLTFPPGTTPDQRKMSLHLLGMLCRPYNDPSQEQQTEAALKARWECESTHYEDIRMIEQIDWEFERAKPFRWDPALLSPGSSSFLSREDTLSSVSCTEDRGSTGSESNDAPIEPRNSIGLLWLLGSRSPSGWLPTDQLKPA
ncbi:hypothetical protein Daus18300_004122 [Diaporthe australafricana]|uniref:Transcription factor domain-containing protein n=1 Tax=Diaporthe australafricana TaxID=127596 RepID=A0ABR3XB63_9PEZI